jgi:hypothetical protein
VVDKEILPEQHHVNVIPVELRSYEHGSKDEINASFAKERAGYIDTTQKIEGQTTREIAQFSLANTSITTSTKPFSLSSTRVCKLAYLNNSLFVLISIIETIEPHVVHTTIPIQEVHHNTAKHHSASALPAVSMSDFKQQWGGLTGREGRQDGFVGEPKSTTDPSTTGAGSLNS